MIDYNIERYTDRIWKSAYLYGQAVAIDRVLEIVEKKDVESYNTSAFDIGYTTACEHIRQDVMAMKEGE